LRERKGGRKEGGRRGERGRISHLYRSNLKLDSWDYIFRGFKYDGRNKFWKDYKFWGGGFWILKKRQIFNAGIFIYFIVIFQLQYDEIYLAFICVLRSNSIFNFRYCHRWRLIINIKNYIYCLFFEDRFGMDSNYGPEEPERLL
jgi:hypothetical protein